MHLHLRNVTSPIFISIGRNVGSEKPNLWRKKIFFHKLRKKNFFFTKSCNFPHPSIILSHLNEKRMKFIILLFYNHCQKGSNYGKEWGRFSYDVWHLEGGSEAGRDNNYVSGGSEAVQNFNEEVLNCMDL